MPFKYLMDILRGRETRLDRIEKRLGRIESTLSKNPPVQQTRPQKKEEEKRTSDIGKVKVRRKTKEPSKKPTGMQKARTVHGPDGWHLSEKKAEGDLHFKEFTRNWIIEFDCPCCGKTSARGVKHLWTEFKDDHTKYQVRFSCPHCGWESDEINIRGYK